MNDYTLDYKGYYIKPHKEHPKAYVIVTEGRGGKIPDVMTGMFTDKGTAKLVIDYYLISKEANAKTKPKSGD